MNMLRFIETSVFTRQITDLTTDDDYALFQQRLSEEPEKGDLLVGGSGVRKVRMAAKGKGTRGGARVLYLYFHDRQVIYFLYLFTKGRAENISEAGKKSFTRLAQQIKAGY